MQVEYIRAGNNASQQAVTQWERTSCMNPFGGD
jgi:hypothetical protein